MKVYFVIVAFFWLAIAVSSHPKNDSKKHHSNHHLMKHSSVSKKVTSGSKRDHLGFLNAFNENSSLKNFIQKKIEQNLRNDLDGENRKTRFFDVRDKVSHKKSKPRSPKKVKTANINKDFDADDYNGDIDLDSYESNNSQPPVKVSQKRKEKKNIYKSQAKENDKSPKLIPKIAKTSEKPEQSTNSDPVGTVDAESGSGSGNAGSAEPEEQTPANTYNNGKSSGRIQIPQGSTNQIQANTVNSNSIGQPYPNFPVPPMMPIPLFYNSGDMQSSGASGMNEVKPGKDLQEGVGESGYGENPQVNDYASGDWVQRILTDKERAMKNGGKEDDDDDYEEEEQWMVSSHKNKRPDGDQKQPITNMGPYKTNTEAKKEVYQQKQGSYSAQSQVYQTSQYGNQYQQQYGNYYSPDYMPPQQQIYGQSQSYNQPQQLSVRAPAVVPQAVPEASAASVSAASASYQQHASKSFETPVSANLQSSYMPNVPAANAAKAVSQLAPSAWNSYQTAKQQPQIIGECAASCPSSCAPSCNAECCSRGKIASKVQQQQQPAQQYQLLPQWNRNQWSNVPNSQTYQYPSTPDTEVNSVLPGTTIQLPDIMMTSNGASAASYNQPQQQQQNVYPQQTYPQEEVASRNEVQDEPYPEESASMSSYDQQQQFAAENSHQTAQQSPLENVPQEAPKSKPVAQLRPSDAPPPIATLKLEENPRPAPVAPSALVPNRNFALKPVQPIMLTVPSLALRKDTAGSVKYPDAPCMSGCNTKCFPFCSNSCCGTKQK